MNFSQDTTSSLSELPISQEQYENLVTYELTRASINSGFGFDLKGDRPCVIGTVRKGSIADQAGLQEGDVVIAINNKKVTEYDHDQVVRLVGMSKNKLVIQVTKIKVSPKLYKIKKPKSSGYKATTIGIAPHFYPGSSRKKSRSRRKMNITHSSQSTASSSGFGPDLTTNTKTTEDDEDESDLEFYYGTSGSSGRRRRHHHPLHHHKARVHSRKPKRAVRSVPQAVTNSEYVEFYEIEDLETDTEDTEDTEENVVDFKIPKSSRKIRNTSFVGCKQKVPISAKKIAYQQLKKSRKDLNPNSMPPPVLTSTFHLNTKGKIINNVSIESSELEYEPAYAPINPVKGKNQKVSPQYIIYSSAKAINSKTKQVNYEQFTQETYNMSSSLNDSAENRKPICVNIKTGQTDAKIANIKHFNSANQMSSGTLRQPETQKIYQNPEPIQTYYSLSNLNPMPIKQLNSNDLYAILKPVIRPWVFNPKLSINGDLSFNLYYIGSIFIPYDTMSNAAKLNSIRNAIESFLVKTGDTEQSLISFNILVDRLKLINLCDSKSTLKNDNCVFYHKTEIAFCGKIKDSAQFFALVVLAQNSSKHDILMNNSTSCLIFRHLSGISIDLILNEISRLYRHQDYVFTSTSNLAVHGGQMPLMTNNNQNLSPVLHFSNHNYEIVTEEHPVIDAEKSPYMMLNKHTNDIYFNKENFLKEDMAHIPKDVSSLSNIEDNNMDSMNSSNGSKSIKNKKSKTQPKEVGSQPQGIKTIKENFANLFLSKKTHTNDSEIYKTIEMEANRFRKNDDGSNFRIKTRTSQAFQFLKSKPPLSVAQKIKPHQNSEDDNLDFFDANHILSSFEPNQAHNQENNVHNRMSYPVNDRMSKTTATAKRLLFNFISGNSNNSKENQNRPQQFQTRRLSDYHRPTKSLNANDCENSAKEKLNQTKISLTNSLIDVNEEIIKEKSNEIGRVAKWATGFEKLLEDQLGLNIFTDFLKKEYSEENIDFWVRCEKFKKISDLDEMKKEAEDIWQTYLDTSSQCQINVDNKTRSNCKEGMQNPHCKMFELAQSQIFTLMKYDSYSRFLKSQMYKDCIVNEMEGKPILGDKHEDKNSDKKRNSFSQNQANQSPNSNSSSNTNLSNEPVRKEKKKNILPWSKVKEKKFAINPRTPTPSSGLSATLSKQFLQKTPLLLSMDTCSSQPNLNQVSSPHDVRLNSKIDSKFCRVLCNKDGSSTMIQPLPGQTVHQALSKIYVKKNLPWYKSDLYFVGNYSTVDQNMNAQILISKEICLVERSLFVLSLIPVAINLCIKANMKKPINLVLQPILDHYQINMSCCSIFLLQNSGIQNLNLNDFCSSIDCQNVLVVHKQPSNLLSQNEIDKITKISVNDLLPSNMDLNIQFDKLGILKQIQTDNLKTSSVTPIQPKMSHSPVIKKHASKQEDPNEKNFIDLLKRAQNYSLEDQRGRIDSRHLQIPEFLLTSSNLIKSQSMTQNLGKFSFELNTLSNYNDSVNDLHYQTNNSFDYNLIYQQNNLLGMQGINKSSVSLPVESNYTALPVRYQTIRNTTTTANRTRSPVMIVYDNEDYQDIDYICENRHDLSDKLNDTPMNYESISETNSPVKLNSNLSNTSFTQDNSRISYV